MGYARRGRCAAATSARAILMFYPVPDNYRVRDTVKICDQLTRDGRSTRLSGYRPGGPADAYNDEDPRSRTVQG
ncbi:hypothetical protein Trydic_g12630 [Trypoxylus dichotomus]